MSLSAEYLEQLLQTTTEDRSKKIINQWQEVDKVTMASTLVLRFEKIFKDYGLSPDYLVATKAFMYGMPVPINMRFIIVDSKSKILPGFCITHYVHSNNGDMSRDIINVDLGHVDIENTEKQQEEELEAETAPPAKPQEKPYWWPETYPTNAVNVITNSDAYGVALMMPPDFMIVDQHLRISPIGGDYQKFFDDQKGIIDSYFSALAKQLEGPQN